MKGLLTPAPTTAADAPQPSQATAIATSADTPSASPPADRCGQLAAIVFHSGKYQEAAALIDKALLQQPDDAELLHLRGRCLEGMQNIPGQLESSTARETCI